MFLGFGLISFGSFISFFPWTDDGDLRDVRYHIYDITTENQIVYIEKQLPIKINSLGLIMSVIKVIPIQYGAYGFDISSKGSDNFRLFTDGLKKEIIINKYSELKEFDKSPKNGFSNIILREADGIALLKFDRFYLKEHIVKNITLEGLVKENIRDKNYTYFDNTEENNVCNGNKCSLILNWTNRLDLPVIQEQGTILKLDDRNVNSSNCHFVNYSLEYNSVDNILPMVGHTCKDSTQCTIELTENTFYSFIRIENGFVWLQKTKFNRPLSVQATFMIEC